MPSCRFIRRCWCTVAIASTLAGFSCGDCVETPSISSITPTNAVVGSLGLELIVNGNHFQRNSTVNWNGMARGTAFVNGHQLKATIAAEDLATATMVKVTVFSPPQSQSVTFGSSAASSASASTTADCAGGTSQALNFTVSP